MNINKIKCQSFDNNEIVNECLVLLPLHSRASREVVARFRLLSRLALGIVQRALTSGEMLSCKDSSLSQNTNHSPWA